MKNNQPLRLRSKPNHPCHQFPNTPNPCPYTHTHTHLPQTPALATHSDTQHAAPPQEPLPTGNHGHLRGPSAPQHELLSPHSLTTADRRAPRLAGLPTPHPPTPAPSPLPRPRFPPGSRGDCPNLPSLYSTLPNTFTPPQRAPRLQPRGPAQACGDRHPRLTPLKLLGPGAPALTGASGREVRRTPPDARPSTAHRPRSAGVRSCLLGPPGRRSPGRCPQARFLRPLERRGRRFPGTHLELVVNISPGFPSTNSSTRVLPSPPPTYLSAEDPPSSATPPPSARGPSRPPLTSAAGLRVGAGRRTV